jgi:DNA-binding transcriptional LysR family regulator
MSDRLTAMSVFACVVEARSFSAAAAKLATSKSRVSRCVSTLERELSVKLLHRSTRKLSLTEAGALFYEHCARIVKEADLAEQRMTRAQSEPEGLVKVTAVPAFAIRHVVPAIAEFHQRYPRIRVKLSCSNRRAVDLGDEGFDLGIRIHAQPPDPKLVTRKLAANRVVLCASPAYLDRRGTPRRPDDLRQHECVVFPPTAPKGAWTFRRGRRTHSVDIHGALETDETEAVRAAVMAGMGVGILPLYMASDALREGKLVPLLRDFAIVNDSVIHLVYLPNSTLPSRVRALIDFLVGRFAPVPPWEEVDYLGASIAASVSSLLTR